MQAASGKPVSDFGARRAHNVDAAVYGARAAYIGGAVGTATVLAGKRIHNRPLRHRVNVSSEFEMQKIVKKFFCKQIF